MQKYLKGSLKLTDAQSRFQLISLSQEISYKLFLKIHKGDSYEGDLTVTFSLNQLSPHLFFDFAGTTIHEITINSTTVPTTDSYESLRQERYLTLPESHLKVGSNTVRVRFTNIYANDGLGLHSFVDTDGKQYIYSQLEAYAANKVFPCFDQPDLKATLSLTMALPKEWVAISNEPISPESEKLDPAQYLTENERETHKVVNFLKTHKLPTYLYAFIAGPYLEIKASVIHKDITMSCYCRESLFKHMKEQAEEIFEITRECLKFFEEFFNYPYPFSKYDSIFCPEYKFGAMENAGAITFNDLYIWRGNVTKDRNTVRAATITHEASHHWFGNLVTMKWWNDLWLNESFAVYISYFCLTQIQDKLTTVKFSDVWLKFFNRKCTGYNADEKKTTHPVYVHVSNTEEAETIFDSITYSKGASTLKQLVSLIGVENFSKAISNYFHRFAWSNTTMEDFTSCLQEFYTPSFPGCPKDLKEWRHEWIEIAGLNQVFPLFDPSNHNENATLVIKQSSVLEEYPTLRHHKLHIAFLDREGKIYEEKEVLLTNTPETKIAYDGSKKPSAVLVNSKDEAFVKVILDEHSLAFFKENIVAVQNELARGLIWRSISDMVRDGRLSGYQFALIAEKAIVAEESDSILETIFLFITTFLFHLSPNILNSNLIKPKLFASVLQVLLRTPKENANRRTLLVSHLIQFASYGEEKDVDNISRLILWLEGKDEELAGISLTNGNKWMIVRKLHRYPRVSASTQEEYHKKLAEFDKSDSSRSIGAYCEAARANSDERKKLWDSFLDANDKTSIQIFKEKAAGYNYSLRNTEAHEKAFFDELENVFTVRSNEFASAFYHNLYPTGERLDYYHQRVKELLERTEGLKTLNKLLRNNLDSLETKRRAYEVSAKEVLREFFNISI